MVGLTLLICKFSSCNIKISAAFSVQMIVRRNTKRGHEITIKLMQKQIKMCLFNEMFIDCADVNFEEDEFRRLYSLYMTRRNLRIKGKTLRSGRILEMIVPEGKEAVVEEFNVLYEMVVVLEENRKALLNSTEVSQEQCKDDLRRLKYALIVWLRCLQRYLIHVGDTNYFPPWIENKILIDCTK